MACSRRGCENIMCSIYSDEYGYICYDCKKELETLCKQYPLSHDLIKNFMNSEKHNQTIDEITTVDDIFRGI